jgi:rhodanese-related sulfurtransferase
LLDVREPEELLDGVIAGSVSDVQGDRDIVVICHLGARSEHVTRWLNSLGYNRAVNLDGGMEAWLKTS